MRNISVKMPTPWIQTIGLAALLSNTLSQNHGKVGAIVGSIVECIVTPYNTKQYWVKNRSMWILFWSDFIDLILRMHDGGCYEKSWKWRRRKMFIGNLGENRISSIASRLTQMLFLSDVGMFFPMHDPELYSKISTYYAQLDLVFSIEVRRGT